MIEKMKPLVVNGYTISYGVNDEGEHVVTMIPGRMVTFGNRKIRSRRSTDFVKSEIKAWEKIGDFNEFAKQNTTLSSGSR